MVTVFLSIWRALASNSSTPSSSRFASGLNESKKRSRALPSQVRSSRERSRRHSSAKSDAPRARSDMGQRVRTSRFGSPRPALRDAHPGRLPSQSLEAGAWMDEPRRPVWDEYEHQPARSLPPEVIQPRRIGSPEQVEERLVGQLSVGAVLLTVESDPELRVAAVERQPLAVGRDQGHSASTLELEQDLAVGRHAGGSVAAGLGKEEIELRRPLEIGDHAEDVATRGVLEAYQAGGTGR